MRVATITKCALAICFATYYTTLVYSELFHPRNFGIDLKQNDGHLFISKTLTNFPAGRAGLRTGDQLIAIDETKVKKHEDWQRFLAKRIRGQKYIFAIQRDNQSLKIPVVLQQQPGTLPGWFESKRAVQGPLLPIAFALAFWKSRSMSAQVGALLLAGIGTVPAFPESEMTAIWRNFPAPVGVLLWIPQITHLLLLPLLFTFFALIPSRLFRSFSAWAALWVPGLALAFWCLPRIYNHIYHPPTLVSLPFWFHAAMAAIILFYGLAAVAVIWINFFRLPHKARYRLRIFAIGSTLALIPLTLFLSAIFAGALTQSELVWFFVSQPFRHLTLYTFILFPVSLIYAVTRHNLFDWCCEPAEPRSGIVNGPFEAPFL